MLRVSNVHLSLDEDASFLLERVANKLAVSPARIRRLLLLRQAVDARRGLVRLTHTVAVEVAGDESAIAVRCGNDVQILPPEPESVCIHGTLSLRHRPVVVGAGPAGIFAALSLAREGYRPLVLERGDAVTGRVQEVERFFRGSPLDTRTNVQFGEGGAGTFSDGKLTTRIRDPRCTVVLDALVQAGAPEDIRVSAKAHIGTDLLRGVVSALRQQIVSLGGEYRFLSMVDQVETKDGSLAALHISDGERIPAEAAVLAIGHSARDTFEMLYASGVTMEPKPFAMGVRIEHPQTWLDKVQYGAFAGHPRLGAADYQIAVETGGRSVYTFCMCPGGFVVNASSEQGALCVNGMSLRARDGKNANSALLCSVALSDMEGMHPLRGMALQRHWESEAFRLGEGTWRAPAARVADFLARRPGLMFDEVQPTVRPGVVPVEVSRALPAFVGDALRSALPLLDDKLPGFGMGGAVMTGIEARSSSPVRILRGEDGQSVSLKGLFPAGEGAGYAGGIVSAAVDGLRAAEAVMARFAPPQDRV